MPKTEVPFGCPADLRGRMVSTWILLEPGLHLGKKDRSEIKESLSRPHGGASGELVMLLLELGTGDTDMFDLQKFIELCIYDLYTFLYVYFAATKS